MKIDSLRMFGARYLLGAALAAMVVIPASADPLLPYLAPVAAKLSDDIAALEGNPSRTADENQQLQTEKAALRAYHRRVTTLSGDIRTLASLRSSLAGISGFDSEIDTAANDYVNEFAARRAGLEQDLLIAPKSNLKTLAFRQLRSVSNHVAAATEAPSSSDRITQLRLAASGLTQVARTVTSARKVTVRPSSVSAKIGSLSFVSSPAGTIGLFTTNGVLDIAGIRSGSLGRGVWIHLEDVGTNTPATYYLGEGANTAIYTANDSANNRTYQFQAESGSETNRSYVTIDAITPRYMVGRFGFTSTLFSHLGIPDTTNRVASMTNGNFQLNFY